MCFLIFSVDMPAFEIEAHASACEGPLSTQAVTGSRGRAPCLVNLFYLYMNMHIYLCLRLLDVLLDMLQCFFSDSCIFSHGLLCKTGVVSPFGRY